MKIKEMLFLSVFWLCTDIYVNDLVNSDLVTIQEFPKSVMLVF